MMSRPSASRAVVRFTAYPHALGWLGSDLVPGNVRQIRTQDRSPPNQVGEGWRSWSALAEDDRAAGGHGHGGGVGGAGEQVGAGGVHPDVRSAGVEQEKGRAAG